MDGDVAVSVESQSEANRLINIEIPFEIFDKRFNANLSRLATQARVKGFRPGRAPRALLIKLYGAQINDDVLNEIVGSAYRDVVRDNSLKVVGSPRITVDQFEPKKNVKVKAEISLLPEPEIKDYLNVEVDVEIDEVRDEDVERVITELLERNRTSEPLERTVAEVGDLATIAYEGLIDGKPFRGSEGKDLVVEAGRGQIPQEIDAAILGMNVGESRSVEMVLPEEAGDPKLVGKTAAYTITLSALGRKKLPDLNDEFVKTTGAAETVAEFRENVRKRLENEIGERNRNAKESAIFRAIAERNDFEIPLVMVDDEIRSIFFEQGMLDPNQEDSYKVDLSQFRENLGTLATERLKRGIIVAQIVKQEKIEIGDEEIESWLDEQATLHKMPREKVAEAYGVRKNSARIKGSLAVKKATQLLLSKAKISETVRAADADAEKGAAKEKGSKRAKGGGKSSKAKADKD